MALEEAASLNLTSRLLCCLLAALILSIGKALKGPESALGETTERLRMEHREVNHQVVSCGGELSLTLTFPARQALVRRLSLYWVVKVTTEAWECL